MTQSEIVGAIRGLALCFLGGFFWGALLLNDNPVSNSIRRMWDEIKVAVLHSFPAWIKRSQRHGR